MPLLEMALVIAATLSACIGFAAYIGWRHLAR
jgi:hypothetical protein